MVSITGIGQDSHCFADNNKVLILAGIKFENHQGLKANSDGDVILHALTNAISSITTHNILGSIADEMCQNGIIDSSNYLKLALKDLQNLNYTIDHIAIAIECLVPKISPKIQIMRKSIANLVKINKNNIGITTTTGEGLSEYGKGIGIFVNVIISVTCN